MYFIGLLCIKKKDEPEEEWQAFTESLFLVVKDCFTCCHAAETKGPFNSLPNNFNHQIYPPDLLIVFTATNIYWSKIQVLFMVANFNCTFCVVEIFLIMKSTDELDK